jgi:hypothetical protein
MQRFQQRDMPFMFNRDVLKEKRILVTGGGTGLGKVMAEKFVELRARGARLHLWPPAGSSRAGRGRNSCALGRAG